MRRFSTLLTSNAKKSFNASASLNQGLKENDQQIFQIIEKEKQRQRNSINLIASENYASKAVMEALGSVMQNKYSEGYPGAR